MITIIDYGMGNLYSVQKAIERLGYHSQIAETKKQVLEADRLILPGVGAFGDAMDNIQQRDLIEPIKEHIKAGKYFLGICLGMQLLFDSSEEKGKHRGLEILAGNIVRFQGDYKIPHMGWNKLIPQQVTHPLLLDIDMGFVYFVHSYYADIKDSSILLASTDYYGRVPAIVGKENVVGMQFHPEKSGRVGMELLKRFAEWSGE